MQQTTIFLIRHGKVDNPARILYGPDISLNEEGRRDLFVLGQKLVQRQEDPVAIYTSDYNRALQSAKEIQKSFPGVPILTRKGLRETYAPGLIGIPLDRLRSIGDIYSTSEFPNIEIESPKNIIQRGRKTFREIKRKHKGETVFCIGHRDHFAFFLWTELYPREKLPPISDLKDITWLETGEAWRIVYDLGGKFLECELIRREEQLIAREREC